MSFLLYGAYGYTGRLIAETAVASGRRPILAGRDEARLAALASELDLTYRVAALGDAAALDEALRDVSLVLHCAGPFYHTAPPMVAACLHHGVHYLDVTGEIAVYEALAARDAEARAAGVLLLPGVGFDVVPSDSLALHLKQRLPSATHLELAIRSSGGVSRGTARTAIENLGQGGAIRRAGRLTRVPAAWKTRTVDFGDRVAEVVSIPWGDVSTAYRTTGIPNIVVYAALGRSERRLLRLSRYAGPLLASRPVQALLKAWLRQQPPGPDAEQRARGRSVVWGHARDDDGRAVTARLTGPEAYLFTARAALAAADAVEAGSVMPGYHTPAGLFGADFVLGIDGVAIRF